MFGLRPKGIGFDLGTTNTHIFIPKKGVVLRESSVVAKNKESNEILAFGNEARNMIGRTPEAITVSSPLKRGTIADYETTASMIGYFLKEVSKFSGGFGKKYSLIIGIPSDSTSVEKRAVLDAAKQAGAFEAFTIERILAAGLGAGLPVGEPSGSMIVDVGGGTTETAVFSLNGIVTSDCSKAAGQTMDEAIIRYIQTVHHLKIGSRTAEAIKIEIGSAFTFNKAEREVGMTVAGQNLMNGGPKVMHITAGEIEEALADPIAIIIDTIKRTLEKTPPELSADIMARGIVLAGGGALLKNLDKVLSWSLKIPVTVVDNPSDCVAQGTGKALYNLIRMRKNHVHL